MDDTQHAPALARIEAALARIERATADRDRSVELLRDRHAALRARMADAVAALDAAIARAEGDE